MNFGHITVIIGLFSYAAASVLYLSAFPTSQSKNWLGRLAFGIFTAATIFTSFALAIAPLYGVYNQTSGLLLVACISWLTIVGFFAFKMRLMGAFVAPLATLIILFQLFTIPLTHHAHTTPPGAFVSLHIILAILGQAFAICACAVSILYLLQQQALKKKQLDRLTTAPPIDKLDRALFISLWAGFSFLTLALITGAIYAQFYMPASLGGLEWKVIWAFLIWGWYLAILLARNIFSLPGRRIAQLSLVGFILLAAALFGLLPMGGGSGL